MIEPVFSDYFFSGIRQSLATGFVDGSDFMVLSEDNDNIAGKVNDVINIGSR